MFAANRTWKVQGNSIYRLDYTLLLNHYIKLVKLEYCWNKLETP